MSASSSRPSRSFVRASFDAVTSFVAALASSLRFSLRSLAKQPGFAAVAILALGLGIGANTAIFGVIDAVLLQPLPYDQPDRLVILDRARTDGEPVGNNHAYPDLIDLREQSEVFEELVAVVSGEATLTGEGSPRRIRGARVTEGFLDMLGWQPLIGRDLEPEDFAADAERVVLLGHDLWKQSFGGREQVLGRVLTIDGNPATVIGVLPPGLLFQGYLSGAELLGPIVDGQYKNRGSHFLEAYGRLRDGVTLERATADVSAVFARLEAEYPEMNANKTAIVGRLQESMVGDVRQVLWVLVASVGMVLLIACANVANMLLARGAARRKEAAVRSALGAGRAAIAGLFLGEAMVLSFAGGVLGVALAGWSTEWLVALAPDGLPRLHEVGLDARALVAALALSIATGVVSGLVPALLMAGRDPRDGLAESVRGGAERGAKLRSALVVAEIAASLVLLVGAGLLVRSFQNLLDVDPGFRPDGVAIFELELPRSRYEDRASRSQASLQLIDELEALPEVQRAGATLTLPFSETSINIDLWPVGKPLPRVADAPAESFHVVTEGYFDAMGMQLVEGRLFDGTDDGTPRTIVINQALADQYWPGKEPLGQRVMVNLSPDTTEDDAYEVIGVVANVRHRLHLQPPAEMYLPQRQFGVDYLYVALRTEGDPARLAEPVRRAVAAFDPDLPAQIRPLSDYVSQTLVQRRFVMFLLTLLGALALVLASVGIYGVMAYTVSLQRKELSIRIALGAGTQRILGGVLRRTLAMALAGVVLGLGCAALLGRFLESLVYGIGTHDPMTYCGLATALVAVAALAGLGPAHRATRVDPMEVLREE